MGRLLVVDDEEIIRDILQDIVVTNCAGVAVDTASCGEEALDKLTPGKYDLVFLDMKMKSSDGLQTFRRIRQIAPTQKVFIITGYFDEDLIQTAIKEGACGTVYKPFGVDQILDIIEKHLSEYQRT